MFGCGAQYCDGAVPIISALLRQKGGSRVKDSLGNIDPVSKNKLTSKKEFGCVGRIVLSY